MTMARRVLGIIRTWNPLHDVLFDLFFLGQTHEIVGNVIQLSELAEEARCDNIISNCRLLDFIEDPKVISFVPVKHYVGSPSLVPKRDTLVGVFFVLSGRTIPDLLAMRCQSQIVDAVVQTVSIGMINLKPAGNRPIYRLPDYPVQVMDNLLPIHHLGCPAITCF